MTEIYSRCQYYVSVQRNRQVLYDKVGEDKRGGGGEGGKRREVWCLKVVAECFKRTIVEAERNVASSGI